MEMKHLLVHIVDTDSTDVITPSYIVTKTRHVKRLNHYDAEYTVASYNDVKNISKLPQFNDYYFLTVVFYSYNSKKNKDFVKLSRIEANIGDYTYMTGNCRTITGIFYFYNKKYIKNKFVLDGYSSFETACTSEDCDCIKIYNSLFMNELYTNKTNATLKNHNIGLNIFKDLKTPMLLLSKINKNSPAMLEITQNYSISDTDLCLDCLNYIVYLVNEIQIKTKPAI